MCACVCVLNVCRVNLLLSEPWAGIVVGARLLNSYPGYRLIAVATVSSGLVGMRGRLPAVYKCI